MNDNNTAGKTYTSGTTGTVCPNCGKPYWYIGDVFGDVTSLICQCRTTSPLNPYCRPNYPLVNTPLQGWECPKCKRIYSPSVTECWKCNDAMFFTASASSNQEDLEDGE